MVTVWPSGPDVCVLCIGVVMHRTSHKCAVYGVCLKDARCSVREFCFSSAGSIHSVLAWFVMGCLKRNQPESQAPKGRSPKADMISSSDPGSLDRLNPQSLSPETPHL